MHEKDDKARQLPAKKQAMARNPLQRFGDQE